MLLLKYDYSIRNRKSRTKVEKNLKSYQPTSHISTTKLITTSSSDTESQKLYKIPF